MSVSLERRQLTCGQLRANKMHMGLQHVVKYKYSGAGPFVPWTFRTQDVSYPGRIIRTQRFRRFVPIVWTIRTQGLDDSYPMFCFFNFYSLFGHFVPQLVGFIQPVGGWSIRTHVLFITNT